MLLAFCCPAVRAVGVWQGKAKSVSRTQCRFAGGLRTVGVRKFDFVVDTELLGCCSAQQRDVAEPVVQLAQYDTLKPQSPAETLRSRQCFVFACVGEPNQKVEFAAPSAVGPLRSSTDAQVYSLSASPFLSAFPYVFLCRVVCLSSATVFITLHI